MAVKIVIDRQAKPGSGDALLQVYRGLLPDTRAFAGCIECEIFRNEDDPENFVIIELFESREAYQQYADWRVGSGVLPSVFEHLATPTAPTRFYSATDA